MNAFFNLHEINVMHLYMGHNDTFVNHAEFSAFVSVNDRCMTLIPGLPVYI
jgi:hypothetical protein